MDWLSEFGRKLLMLLRGRQFDRELEEEMRLHRELRERQQAEAGLDPDEARYAARRLFGNDLVLREQSRDSWGWRSVETLGQDVRYAWRQFGRNPGFAAAAVAVIALGIGANTLIFSEVNAVLLHPLPFRDASGIMTLWMADAKSGYSGPAIVCDPDYAAWRSQDQVFDQIAAFRWETGNLTGTGEPLRLVGSEATASLFPLLGVNAALGRTYSPVEEQAGQDRVVLLSDKVWRTHLGADRTVVGRALKLDGKVYTVAGIMPAGFRFPNESDFWVPMSFANNCNNASLQTVVRLRPGLSLDRARAMVAVVGKRLGAQREDQGRAQVSLMRIADQLGAGLRTSLFVLLGSVALVLLIACANVANLLLARAATRQREMAVRTALGAGRLRIVRQMLIESLMLAVLGGALGLGLALAGQPLIASAATYLPRNLMSATVAARIAAAGIDGWVLAFTLAVSIVTGVLFGLVPALQAARVDLSAAVREGARTSTAGRGHTRLRDVLVAVEVAVALVLLTGSGLMIRSLAKLTSVNPGFDPHGVLTMNMSLPESSYTARSQMIAFEEKTTDGLSRLPGVRATGAIFGLPLGEMGVQGDYVVEGRDPNQHDQPSAAKHVVGGDYFRAIGIPLLSGRFFGVADAADAPRAVIVNERFAKLYWPHENPIGKRVDPGFTPGQWCTVVGVVGDVHQDALAETPAPAIYLPYEQSPRDFLMRDLTLVARTSVPPLTVAHAAESVVAAADPNLPVFDTSTMDELVYRSASEPRLDAILLGIFAALAVILAAVGIYGVMAYSVAQRTHEIGVRMALGASVSDVVRDTVRRGLGSAGIGVAFGLAGALALTRILASLLFGVTPTDPATFLAVSALLVVVAFVASYLPARRAARVDPILALRHE